MTLMDTSNVASSKRFVTLVLAIHFIVASFIILFFAFYMILNETKGTVNKDLLDLLSAVLEYDFYIILAGLGFITAEGMVSILLEKMKVQAAANVATGNPTVDVMNVDTLAKTVNTENIEQVTTNTTNTNPDLRPSKDQDKDSIEKAGD